MDFYYLPASATCRSVLMTAKALRVELNKKRTELSAGEHMTPEFIKINPQHCIPTLDDNGFSVWESRAILIYLVEKYGTADDDLYPNNPKQRAVINQRLYFDMGSMYQSFSDYYYPQMFDKTPGDPEKMKSIEVAFDYLETFLQAQKYVAGGTLTLADIALASTVSTFATCGFDFSKYINVAKWYKTCAAEIPGWDENLAGCEELKQLFL